MKTNRFIPKVRLGAMTRLILAALLIAGGSLSTEAKKKKKRCRPRAADVSD